MYVCLHVDRQACRSMYVCMYCMYARMYVYMHVSMFVHVCIKAGIHEYVCTRCGLHFSDYFPRKCIWHLRDYCLQEHFLHSVRTKCLDPPRKEFLLVSTNGIDGFWTKDFCSGMKYLNLLRK